MNRYTKLTFLREIGMWIVAIIILLPFYILINTSLKSKNDAISTAGYELVKNPSLESFAEISILSNQHALLLSLSSKIS